MTNWTNELIKQKEEYIEGTSMFRETAIYKLVKIVKEKRVDGEWTEIETIAV